MKTIHQQIDLLGHRIDDAVVELGYVLKAIEELSVEKGVMTRAEIQKKIMELTEAGWAPSALSEGEQDEQRISD